MNSRRGSIRQLCRQDPQLFGNGSERFGRVRRLTGKDLLSGAEARAEGDGAGSGDPPGLLQRQRVVVGDDCMPSGTRGLVWGNR
jgi:hypothetical protein